MLRSSTDLTVATGMGLVSLFFLVGEDTDDTTFSLSSVCLSILVQLDVSLSSSCSVIGHSLFFVVLSPSTSLPANREHNS